MSDAGRPESASAFDAIVGLVAAFAAGAVVGTLTTFKHAVGVSPTTGAGLPLGLVLSTALIAVFLVVLRTLFVRRLVAVAAGIGLIVAAVLFAQPGPGGSVVVVGDWVGVLWTFLPALTAVAVLLLPRSQRNAGGAAA